MRTAVITGSSGQDGSFLSEYLISKGYFVIGIDRRRATNGTEHPSNILSIEKNPLFKLINGDITDTVFITRLIADYKPEKFFNLAAMSHVGQSFQEPLSTFKTDAESVIGILEAIRRFSPQTRFYQASTSELWGGIACPETGYSEDSPFHPRSPYGVAKLAAHWATINYREAHGLFSCAGLLFNHESERRGMDFVTRKITYGVAQIYQGKSDYITLGNIDAVRDWGYSKEYVVAMDMMLEANEPTEYVVATGKAYSVRDFLSMAFKSIGISDYDKYVRFDPRFMRPSEVPYLLGNPSKIKSELGWEAKTDLQGLVDIMVKNDLSNR